MPDPGELRVSDQDRERAASEIREHFAAGRLSEDELNERVQAAYQARTQRELDALQADLPRLPATKAQQRAEVAARRAALRRRLMQESGGAFVAFLVCTAIWVASGAQGSFWPIWVGLFAMIPVLRNGWRLYGPGADLDRLENELARREQRDEMRRDLRRRHRP
jgi:uncharacterized membrane protein YccC